VLLGVQLWVHGTVQAGGCSFHRVSSNHCTWQGHQWAGKGSTQRQLGVRTLTTASNFVHGHEDLHVIDGAINFCTHLQGREKVEIETTIIMQLN